MNSRSRCQFPILLRFPRTNQVCHIPEPICHSGSHSGRHPQRAVNLDEVVGKVAKRHSGSMILDLLTEGVGQSGESTNGHTDRKIMPFRITSADILWVRGAGNCVALVSEADSGAITSLFIFRNAIDLHQLSEVDIIAKCLIYRLDIKLQAIASELDAIRQPTRKVFDEITSADGVTLGNEPAWNQFCISVNRGPQPGVASARILLGDLRRDVFLFAIAIRPAFIDLHPFAFQVAEHAVLVIGAERPKFHDQPNSGFFGDSRHANGGPDGATLNQATDDLGALFGSEAVHTSIMRGPLTHVKTFEKSW